MSSITCYSSPPFSSKFSNRKKMADEKMEFDTTGVVTMADGVEVQTIAEGQALKNETPDLDFIVQEEVETTTDGPQIPEEDPVKNVLLSLQQSGADGHDQEEDIVEEAGEEDGARELEIKVDDDYDYSPTGTPKKKPKTSRRKGKRKRSSGRKVTISVSPQDSGRVIQTSETRRSGRKWSKTKQLQVQTLGPGELNAASCCLSCRVMNFFSLLIEDKPKLIEDDPDFYEYTRGRKIPPEGLPGFDFNDPDHIVEFTKFVACVTFPTPVVLIFFFLSPSLYRRTKMKHPRDGGERSVPCPHKVGCLFDPSL